MCHLRPTRATATTPGAGNDLASYSLSVGASPDMEMEVLKTEPLLFWEMVGYISELYGLPEAQAERVVRIAAVHGAKAEPCDHGYFTVNGYFPARVAHDNLYVLTDRERDPSDDRPAAASVTIRHRARQTVARSARVGYDRPLPGNHPQQRRRSNMPRRPAAQVAEPEPEVEADDLTVYADKEITETMQDFHEWLEQETGIKLDLRSVALGGTLRMKFQQSDFNKERRAQRQAARANGAAPEPAATPARGRAGKAPGKATAAPTAARTARPGKTKATTAPAAKPAAPRRRGAGTAPY